VWRYLLTSASRSASIRAYGAQEVFHAELRKRIDKWMRVALTSYNINRWISIRIDSLGAVFAGVVATYITYSGHIGSGSAGFTLNVVLSFTGLILLWVRFYNLLEIEGKPLSYCWDFY
jgi:hypothetical protein